MGVGNRQPVGVNYTHPKFQKAYINTRQTQISYCLIKYFPIPHKSGYKETDAWACGRSIWKKKNKRMKKKKWTINPPLQIWLVVEVVLNLKRRGKRSVCSSRSFWKAKKKKKKNWISLSTLLSMLMAAWLRRYIPVSVFRRPLPVPPLNYDVTEN